MFKKSELLFYLIRVNYSSNFQKNDELWRKSLIFYFRQNDLIMFKVYRPYLLKFTNLLEFISLHVKGYKIYIQWFNNKLISCSSIKSDFLIHSVDSWDATQVVKDLPAM